MGQNVNNLELVKDYADDRTFIRLHRDIEIPAFAADAVRNLLEAGRWNEAKIVVLEHATSEVEEELSLFFGTTAALNTCR